MPGRQLLLQPVDAGPKKKTAKRVRIGYRNWPNNILNHQGRSLALCQLIISLLQLQNRSRWHVSSCAKLRATGDRFGSVGSWSKLWLHWRAPTMGCLHSTRRRRVLSAGLLGLEIATLSFSKCIGFNLRSHAKLRDLEFIIGFIVIHCWVQ